MTDLSPTIRLALMDREIEVADQEGLDALLAETRAAHERHASPETSYLLGRLLICAEQWHAGFPLLDAAVQANPRSVPALAERGLAYGISEGYAKAMLDLKLAQQIDPRHYRAWAYRAALHVKRGNWGDVVEDAERAIAIAPHYAPAHRLLGIGWQASGRGDKAIDAFQDYLTRVPDAPDRLQIENAIANIQQPPAEPSLLDRLRKLFKR